MLVQLSPVIGKWFVTFALWGTWFDCSNHSQDCSNWFFHHKLGILCFNQLIWPFLYIGWLSFSLSFYHPYIQWQFFHTLLSSLFNIPLSIFFLSRWGTLAFADGYGRSSLSWHDCWEWSDLFSLTRFPSWSRSSNWKFIFPNIFGFSRGLSWILWSNR